MWRHINGRQYYYRSVWRNGKPRSVYVGRDEFADFAAELDEMDRRAAEARKRADREAFDELRRSHEAEDQRIDEYHDAVDRAVADALTAAGYWRGGQRRAWRRRRVPRVERDERDHPVPDRRDHDAPAEQGV